jgi:hypothetical protein
MKVFSFWEWELGYGFYSFLLNGGNKESSVLAED